MTGITTAIDVSFDETTQHQHVALAIDKGCGTLTTTIDILLHDSPPADDDVCVLLVYRFGRSLCSLGLYHAVDPVGMTVRCIAVVIGNGVRLRLLIII